MGLMSKSDSDGARFLDRLPVHTRMEISRNLELLKLRMEERFQRTRGEFLMVADRLSFKFEIKKQDGYDVYGIVDERSTLYKEADGTGEDLAVRRIMSSFDPILQQHILLRRGSINTIFELKSQLYEKITVVRQQWQSQHNAHKS